MSQDQAIGVIALLGALVLFGGRLAARRLPTARFVRLALIWASIFVAAVVLVHVAGLP